MYYILFNIGSFDFHAIISDFRLNIVTGNNAEVNYFQVLISCMSKAIYYLIYFGHHKYCILLRRLLLVSI